MSPDITIYVYYCKDCGEEFDSFEDELHIFCPECKSPNVELLYITEKD